MGLPTLRGGFVGNDDKHLVLNHVLVNHPSFAHAIEIFRIPHRDLYQPIPLVSFSMEFAIANALGLFDRGVEGGAWLFHLTNVLLHAVNAVLVFLIVRRLYAWAADATNPMPEWVAAATAILFAVHPLQVEVVAWINGRMMLMSTLFALGAVLTFASWMERGRFRSALWTVVLVALCMMSKVRVGVPVTLALMALTLAGPASSSGGALTRMLRCAAALLRSPRFLVVWGMATAITAMFVVINVGVTAQNTELFELAAEHLRGPRAVRVLLAISWYVAHFFWPVGLASWYPAPGTVSWSDPSTLRAIGILVALFGGLMLLRKQRTVVWLAMLWFLGTLVDTLPIVPARNLLAADRYVYFSMVGLCWIIANIGVDLYRRIAASSAHPILRAATPLLGASIVAALLAMSWHLQPFYETSIGKTTRIAALFPLQPHVWARLAWAHQHAGVAAMEAGDAGRATQHFDQAIQFAERELTQPDRSGWCEAYQALGATQLKLGNTEAGLAAMRQAVSAEPEEGEPKYRLGLSLDELGRIDEALPLLEASFAIGPQHNPTILRLARLYRRLSRPADARAMYEKALANNQYEVPAALGLAELDMEAGKAENLAAAEKRLVDLLDWMPENAAAHVSLGVVLGRTGRTAESVREYQRAIEIEPCNISALLNLAQTQEASAAPLFEQADLCGPETVGQADRISEFWLARQNKRRAVEVWQRFLAAKPGATEARTYAAWTLAAAGEFEQAEKMLLTTGDPIGANYLALSVRVYIALGRGNYADAAGLTGDLCKAGPSATEARRRLLKGLELFEGENPTVPWTLCLAAGLLTAEGNTSAAGAFWKLCEQSCPDPACGAFRDGMAQWTP